MNRRDAANLYQHMLAAWPAARSTHTPDTVELWVGRLARFGDHEAADAVIACIDRCTFFPSIAELNAEIDLARERRTVALELKILEAERAEMDPTIGAKVKTLAGALKTDRKTVITADDLDRAGVVRWRLRLEDADKADSDRGDHQRTEYDLAWSAVKAEMA